MKVEQYKEKLQNEISRLSKASNVSPLDIQHAFRKHPISFEKALSIARRENPNLLVWNCCEYKRGYMFLIGSKPERDPSSETAPSSWHFFFHVNYYTGAVSSFSFAELEMNLRFCRAQERKTVWIDVTEEETHPDSPELSRLRKKLLSVLILEENQNAPDEDRNGRENTEN